MKTYVVVGTQWGDEGKGKLIDVLSGEMDYVVRYQGGNNAGHTVWIGEEKFVLHLLPSGILSPMAECIIAPGVVVDISVLLSEIQNLKERGNWAIKLSIDERAHVIMPYHIAIDKAIEEHRGERKIGTTGRGVGPCYEDKIGRQGIRMIDLLDSDGLKKKIEHHVKDKNMLLKYYGKEELSPLAVYNEIFPLIENIKPMIKDTVIELNKAIEQGRKVLFEGAQATMLDISLGTYPYVTSSSPTAGGVCTGTGVPPSRLGRVFGVMKAYVTRVGEGPFPTELTNDLGEMIRERGQERGATTGRPRRCGWLDLVVGRYAVMVNGLDQIVLTKIDILSGIETLKVAVGYKIKGKYYDIFPSHLEISDDVEVVYESLPGWKEDISKMKNYEDLPLACHQYIELIEKVLKCPISMVSVGPERTQNIIRLPLMD